MIQTIGNLAPGVGVGALGMTDATLVQSASVPVGSFGPASRT